MRISTELFSPFRRACWRIGFACLVGLFLSTTAFAANSAAVFIYHRFGESEFAGTNITIEQFEAQIQELKSGNYHVLPLLEIVQALREGKALPERAVAITIDDAFLSVYTQAWPRLKAAGFPMTLFVAADAVDRGGKSYMTWDQIRQLAQEGVAIGGHTDTHLHMPLADDATNAAEIARSNARLLKELGKAPDLFAYPYGEASLAAQALVRKAGFLAAFGQHSGVVHAGEDPFYLPRFAFSETYGDMARFRIAANALPLPVKDVTPPDMTLRKSDNPPKFGFTVSQDVPGLERLRCYASNQGMAQLERIGDARIEVRLTEPFPRGRARINCTLHTADDRWRWYGRQFYVLE